MAGAVGSVSVGPTKMVGSWVADQIAPKYWVPNSKIVVGEGRKVVTCFNCIHSTHAMVTVPSV